MHLKRYKHLKVNTLYEVNLTRQDSLWKGCTDSILRRSCEVRDKVTKTASSHLCCVKPALTYTNHKPMNYWCQRSHMHCPYVLKWKGIWEGLVSWHHMRAKSKKTDLFFVTELSMWLRYSEPHWQMTKGFYLSLIFSNDIYTQPNLKITTYIIVK